MQLTGGEAMVQQLALEGVTEVFGVPGVQLDWATDALKRHKNRIRYIVPRHEQTASYMADGYARSTGRPGVCMVVPGPGLLNAMAGLATAYACNSRVLCIAGDIHSSGVGKGQGLLHEIRNQTGILGATTKWNGRAGSATDIAPLVRRAFDELGNGVPRPVGIEISHDLLSAKAEIDLVEPALQAAAATPDLSAIESAARLIAACRQPVIYAGGGVLAARASAELARFAERIQAPVVMSDNGMGALSQNHSLALSTLEGRAVFPHADLVIVCGSRFADTTMGNPAWMGGGVKYIYINLDAGVWTGTRHADVAVNADCKSALSALSDACAQRPKSTLDLAKVRDWANAQLAEVEPQLSWVRALRAAIPANGFLVSELTQVGYLARVAYPVFEPHTMINPGYQGTLGYGFPTSLGVAVANPDRLVVSINGDGGFGWGMAELSTARKYNLSVAIVVFADGQFGNVKTLQQQQFGEAYSTELCNPRYDRLAAAFDIPHVRVNEPEGLGQALSEHRERTGPTLIECPVRAMPSPWPLLRLTPPPFAKDKPQRPNPLGEPTAR